MHAKNMVLAASLLGWLCMSGAMGALPAATVQANNAWIRWLPGDLPAGGYVTLVNNSAQPVNLVAVTSVDYGAVSMHQSRTVAGISRMTPVDKITIAAHGSLEFGAEGYHLMLLQPKKSLMPGDRVALTLRFAGSAPLTVQFELRRPDAGAELPDMPGMAH
jgi:periplasmic copper chaperone A